MGIRFTQLNFSRINALGKSYLTKPPARLGSHQAASGAVGKVVSLGMQIAVPTAVGAAIDFQFETRPWCAAGGALFGFVLFFLGILQLAKASVPPVKAHRVSTGEVRGSVQNLSDEESQRNLPDETT